MSIDNESFILRRFGTLFSLPIQVLILYLHYSGLINSKFNQFSFTTSVFLLIFSFALCFFAIRKYYSSNKLLFLILFPFSINLIQNIFVCGFFYYLILTGYSYWTLNLFTLLITLLWGVFFDAAKNKSEIHS
jgi:hypothetical protein